MRLFRVVRDDSYDPIDAAAGLSSAYMEPTLVGWIIAGLVFIGILVGAAL